MNPSWKLAVTSDCADADGTTVYGDIGLDLRAEEGVEWGLVDVEDGGLRPRHLEGFDALLLLSGARVGTEQLVGVTTLKHVARFGAGYDSVDLEACDQQGIVVTNAPTGLRAPSSAPRWASTSSSWTRCSSAATT